LTIYVSGLQPDLFHYRESRGAEIDLVIEHGEGLTTVEIKSGATGNKNLRRFSHRMQDARQLRPVQSQVVYGGDDSQQRSDARVLSWRDVSTVLT
jgi:predicted AAA+ superfamily ATPase